MAFWILNKETNTPAICGSVIAVSEYTGISKDTLYDYFSRKKASEYSNAQFRVCKKRANWMPTLQTEKIKVI
jgi:hypothetical protein